MKKKLGLVVVTIGDAAVRRPSISGTCWAFATVATIEGLNKIKTGKLVSLSEQEIVDCASPAGSDCHAGGLPENAMEWVAAHGGLTTESDYPYEDREGSCRLNKARIVVKIRGGGLVTPNNEVALEVAVARQPVAVGINSENLQHYKSGVFHGPSCDPEKLDHAVTVVGYGAERGGRKYWILKNSWSERWGEKGYFRLERRVEDKRGMCGIAVDPSYPVM
jgi:C1A family cysteine protease